MVCDPPHVTWYVTWYVTWFYVITVGIFEICKLRKFAYSQDFVNMTQMKNNRGTVTFQSFMWQDYVIRRTFIRYAEISSLKCKLILHRPVYAVLTMLYACFSTPTQTYWRKDTPN